MTAPASTTSTPVPTIPIQEFGKDHWSTFAYAETRTVDYDGFLDARHLRTDGVAYPSRLKGREQPNHSDIDCLNDLERAGLLTFGRKAKRTPKGNDPSYFQLGYQVALTTLGRLVAGQLRDHKAKGGRFADFTVTNLETPA